MAVIAPVGSSCCSTASAIAISWPSCSGVSGSMMLPSVMAAVDAVVFVSPWKMGFASTSHPGRVGHPLEIFQPKTGRIAATASRVARPRPILIFS